MYTISTQHSRRWSEEARLAKSLGSKEWHSDEFPGFSFCFIYPKLGAGQAGGPETPTGTDQ